MVTAEFVGRDLRVRWAEHPDNVGADVYEIRYECADDTVVHLVKANDFQSEDEDGIRSYADSLFHADNLAAGLTRNVSVTVKVKGADGIFADASEWVLITANNPPPALVATPLVTSTYDGVDIRIIEPTDTDLAGYRVHMGTSSGFTPSGTGVPGNGTCVYDGVSPTFSVAIPDNSTRYFKIETKDAFGYAGSYYTGTTVSGSRLNFDEAVADTPAVTDLVTVFGDTVAAAESAAEAAASAADAIAAEAAAIIAQGAASTSATNAATSATNAATSNTNAATQATNSAASAAAALTSQTAAATNAANALTSANNAATSNTNAATQASNAATSAANAIIAEGNAETAEANSITQAGNAAVSASSAATSATNASGSASTATTQAGLAAGSATAAGGSATAASTSASNAATSATNSGNSATASQTSRLASESARDAASASASAASTSASSASTSATNAGTSATAANTSATNASTSAGAASTSASNAATSATTASGHAATATTQAGLAATSAGAAGTSATAAAGSATTASTQATNAGTSATAANTARVAAESARDAAGGSATAAATSASGAATSATNAGTSASAASTSATNAATSAGAASTSATNASNSATTASGHASTATTQAGLAATSAGLASGSATAANTSAGNASTSATNAGNSATAANTSAVNAASSYTNTVITGGNFHFVDGLTGWTASSGTYAATHNGRDNVVTFPAASGSKVARNLRRIPVDTTRRYRVTAELYAGAGSGSATSYTGVKCFDATGTYLNERYPAATAVALTPGAGWTTQTGVITGIGATQASFPTGTTSIELFCYTNDNGALMATALNYVTLEDITESTSAANSASAASTSASNASTSASAAGSSATSANTSATNAATSAGAASTSATNASNSATTASGHAATATTQAGLAATSAGAASTSATAANTSAGNASTSATNAGNSATAANTSAVNAASSFSASNVLAAMQFPDRYDGTSGSYFAGFPYYSPAAIAPKSSNATQAGYGPVYDMTGQAGADDFSTVGVLPATPGRIYKAEVEFQRTASTGTPNGATSLALVFRTLESDYVTDTGYMGGTSVALTGSVQTLSYMVSDTASGPGIYNYPAGTVWLRPYVRQSHGTLTAQTIRIRRFTITDVTEQQAALTSATAAATSASAAGTSATNAGTSASAASTSATNASTSAGTASTHATNASNSATSAAGSATTATTQAGLAATSATNAGNSATAANTSAGNASTSATNAGNSATAANASQVAAASSYDATRLTAASTLPSGFAQDGLTWSNSWSGAPPNQAVLTAGAVFSFVTVSGVGRVVQVATAGTNRDVASIGAIPVVAGRTYKITAEARVLSTVSGTPGLEVYFIGLDSSHTSVTTPGAGSYSLVANTWTTLTHSYTTTALLALNSNVAYIRPMARVTGAGSNTYQIRLLRLEDVTESVAAGTSATAAATSASNASTSASAAGSSATSANTSATNAATSAGAASTSATNASNSATTASGHAATATTQAGLAATSASNASSSATAANTSAGNASTSATNAGNSATAAAASSVSAASSYTAARDRAASTFPTVIAADIFSTSYTGDPTSMAGITVTADGAYGPVWQSTAGGAQLATRDVVEALAGRVYEVRATLEWTTVPGGQSPTAIVAVRSLTAAYANVGGAQAPSGSAGYSTGSTSGTVVTLTRRFGSTAPTGGTAWNTPGSTFWLRPYVTLNGSGSSTVRVRSLTIADVTDLVAAETQASAAATSASSASTSAGAAGSSATAASTSATNAATSAGAASTSATNASNSAATASGHAATASTQAGLAATSASNASSSASAANTSAGTASTQATNASNSATAANASQVAANSSYVATVVVDGNTDFSSGATGWTITNGGSVSTSIGGRSGVFTHATSGAASDCYSVKRFPIDPARKYKIKGSYWTGSGGAGSQLYIGFRAFNSAGTALTHNPGSYAYVAVSGTVQAANAGWVDYTSAVIVAQVAGVSYGFPTGTASIELLCLGNYNGGTTPWGLDGIVLLDVTEQEAAATSATAAATSASAASTSASAAGSSATAASGSATTASTNASTAGTHATNSATSATGAAGSATAAAGSATTAGTHASTASTHATTASTQASNASASASSASSSATIAASVGHRALNPNAGFDNYPSATTNTYPASWPMWGSGGNQYRVTDPSGGYSIRMDANAGGDLGIYQLTDAGSLTPDTYYVVEYEAELLSGTWAGVGVFVDFRDASASTGLANDYASAATGADSSGVVSSTKLGRRTWTRLKLVPASTSRAYIYAMAHWSGHGSTAVANQVIFHRALLRPATAQEVAAGVALPALQSSVTTTQATVATLNTNYALARYSVSATTGGGAAILTLTSDTYGTVAGLDAAKIYFGENTVFDNGVDVLVTTWGSNCRITAWGASFGTDSTLTEWEGPTSVTWGNHSRANAYFYRANVAPYAGGSALAPAAPFTVSQSHMSRLGTRVGAGSVTTSTVTLTPSGHTGTVTYTWTNVFGDSSLGATASTSAATAFNGSVAVTQQKQAQFAWTATDSGTGKTVSGYCSATIIETT